MARFDLGNKVQATQDVNAGLEEAYALAKSILDGYGRQGFQVRYNKEQPHTQLEAVFTNSDGSRITASVGLKAAGNRTRFTIKLTGTVVVKGLKGKIATEGMVQDKAQEMLRDEITSALKKNGLAAALDVLRQREAVYAYCVQKQTSQSQYA